MENISDRIAMNPEILGGKPIIKGTRISIEFILELLASGMSVEKYHKRIFSFKKRGCISSRSLCFKDP